MDSSDSWVCNYKNNCLPFLLANKGYDVWLGNNRGNKYSRKHGHLNPNTDKEFWNYSLHEMGTLDLPAMIEFILNKTETNKISYIGHSQGSAQFFAAASLNPEYFSERLNAMCALGPVTTLDNISSKLSKKFVLYNFDSYIEKSGLINEIPRSNYVSDYLKITCLKYAPIIILKILKITSEANPNVIDRFSLKVFLSNFPSGTSIMSVTHFGDIIRKNKFGFYRSKPLNYELKNIKNIPIGLFIGKDDLLATVKDNRILKNVFEESGVLTFYKEYENMGHLTFLTGKTHDHLEDLIPLLEKFNE
jgi:pimeloyl-ACP methyl ester carboxylesterase